MNCSKFDGNRSGHCGHVLVVVLKWIGSGKDHVTVGQYPLTSDHVHAPDEIWDCMKYP